MPSADPFVTTLNHWTEVIMRHSMRNFIRYAKDNDLSMSQLGTLFHLGRKGSTRVTDIGNHLGVSSAAASQMLERLVQQNLILRSEDPIDRRVKKIVITEKGLQVFQDSIRARQSWLDDLAKNLSANEKEQISESLNILIDKVSQLRQPIEPVC